MKSIFLTFLLVFSFAVVKAQVVPYDLNSPDGNVTITIRQSEKNKGLTYDVKFHGETVVLDSRLGVVFNGNNWSEKLQVKGITTTSKDTVWIPVYGKRSEYRDHYNGAQVSLMKPQKKDTIYLDIEIRAYNEGIAFRYVFPERPKGGPGLRITEDLTEFTFPKKTKAWFTRRAQTEYKLLPLKGWKHEAERPLTMVLPNGYYVSLTEADQMDFPRTKFKLDKKKHNTVKCSVYDAVDEIAPFRTPWRVIMPAQRAGELLENNYLILNLNDPCALKNTSWIKPGKVMREVTLTTKGAKELVDFAAKNGLQYIEFDAGWYGYEYHKSSDATTLTLDPNRSKGPLHLQEIINYAGKKDIGVIVYVNQRALQKQLDEILPLYSSWGVKGIKFGFVHVGSYRWTTWLHDAIKKCADNHLMVDIHDEYRPTGFSRTYPNLMTQEGIRGNEEFPDATHNTVLPFTRFVAGAADYTVCYYSQDFDNKYKDPEEKAKARVLHTTSAHQLALPVVYYSPWQFLYWYDKPSDIQGEPELEFFKVVPTVWDDTKVLMGEPGKFVSIARRSGDEWFMGTITNNDKRELKIPLDFLEQGTKYQATVYFDDPSIKTRTKVGIKTITVDSSTVLDVKLMPSGGEAMWIRPLE